MIKFNSHNHYDNCEGCKAIRAEALEEAAEYVEGTSVISKSAIAGGIRSIAAGVAGQPSGDADAAKPCACGEPEDVVHIHGADFCWRPCRGECGGWVNPTNGLCHSGHPLNKDRIKAGSLDAAEGKHKEKGK